MVWNYSELVKKHFFEPENVGTIENADGTGNVGSIACGDALSLTLKIDKETQVIKDAKFRTFGCGSAIASSSMLTKMIIGKKIDEALKVTNKDIVESLGGLPAEKMHCSVMGREALEAAIADYRGEKVEEAHEDEGRIVCNCFGVTEKKIRRVIQEDNLKTLEEVTNYTKAGGGCSACIDEIETILEEYTQKTTSKSEEKPKKAKKLTNLERISHIQEVIDNEIRPQLEKDMGGLELLDIDGTKVHIRMTGQCVGCKAAGFTSSWIQERLREVVDLEIEVIVEED